MTLEYIKLFKKIKHKRRTLLSLCNGIYDPLRLASPYNFKQKILMKETLNVEDPEDWDSLVSPKLIGYWAKAVQGGIQG